MIGTGDGQETSFRLIKSYGETDEPQHRTITRPVAGSISIALDGSSTNDWTMGTPGEIVFDAPPSAGAIITAGFLFDVPVRFASDRLDISQATFLAGDIPEVMMVEVREEL